MCVRYRDRVPVDLDGDRENDRSAVRALTCAQDNSPAHIWGPFRGLLCLSQDGTGTRRSPRSPAPEWLTKHIAVSASSAIASRAEGWGRGCGSGGPPAAAKPRHVTSGTSTPAQREP